jgi:hypothetical protein
MRILFYWLILFIAGFGAASAVDSAIRRLLRPVAPVDLPAKRNAAFNLEIPQRAAVGRDIGAEVVIGPRHPLIVPLVLSGIVPKHGSVARFVSDYAMHTYPFMAETVAQQAHPRNPRAALPDYFDPSATGVTNA